MEWRYIFLLLAVLCCGRSARAENPPRSSTGTDEHIVATVKATRQALIELVAKTNRSIQPVFLTFWDFDGTILKGDCSEGFEENGRKVYSGLAEVGINRGLSALYPPPDGFAKFSEDYNYMNRRVGHWLAYPFLAQAFRGAKLQSLQDMAARHFEDVLHRYYFKSSVTILKQLAALGIEHHVISASADFFVTPAAPGLGLQTTNVHGIQLRENNGVVTEELVYPVTYAAGKTEALRSVVTEVERSHLGRPVFVLAAFGNSYDTDGHFLKFVAEQKLPAGKPLSVMINGGKTPASYQDLFLEVERSETVK
jgi:hypothetical protein